MVPSIVTSTRNVIEEIEEITNIEVDLLRNV